MSLLGARLGGCVGSAIKFATFYCPLQMSSPTGQVRLFTKLSDVPNCVQSLNVKSSLAKKISLWKGDITKLQVDAIVNAANSSLLGGGGVDGAIHRAAGKGLLSECKLLRGCAAGDAKITAAHNISHVKKIIHTVGPQVRGGLSSGHEETLISCYRKSMDLALQNNLKTIAFPCISTGIYGYPNAEACKTVLKTIKEWLGNNGNFDKIDRIVFCVFLEVDEKCYSNFIPLIFDEGCEGKPS